MARDIYIGNAILSYPHLFETWRGSDGTGDPKFGCKLILPQNFNWDLIMPAINEAIADKFGAQPPANLQMPWSVVEDGIYQGRYQVATSGYPDNPPRVVDQNLNPVMDKALVFAGCEVNAYVYASGYDTKGNRGVRLGINAVQIVRNDDGMPRLDSRKEITEIFKPLPGAPAPTASGVGYQPPSTPQPIHPSASAPANTAGFHPGGYAQMPSAQNSAPPAAPSQQAAPGGAVPPGAPPMNPYAPR